MNSEDIQSFIRSLAEQHYSGLPVLLAGSHATNTQSSDSDIDLMVFTDKVNHPEIFGKEIDGHTVEVIEMPYHRPLLFLEKTMANSGTYITMLYTGKVLQDRDDYLLKIKEWAEGVYLAGPPSEGRQRKIYRYLMEITHLLEDLEGSKPALEKFFAANQAIISLNNLLFLAHNLWPMGGKWATRTLDGLYPEYTRRLAEGLKEGIEKGDFDSLTGIIGVCIRPFGGRIRSYQSTLRSHTRTGEAESLKITVPGLYLAEAEPEALATIMTIRKMYPDMYLYTFEEGQGSLGVVIPNPEQNDTRPFETMKQALPGKPVMYSTEPSMYLIYGGKDAKSLSDTYFGLVTDVAAGLKLQIDKKADWNAAVLSQAAYLFPVFCAQMNVLTEQVPDFMKFLYKGWYPETINPDGYLPPDQWETKKENLQADLTQKVNATDPELIELIGAILGDKEIRFDVDLFDKWADGLNAVSEGLHNLAREQKLYSYSLAGTDTAGIWPILKNYLDYLYTLLEVPHKDRLYLVRLLERATTA